MDGLHPYGRIFGKIRDMLVRATCWYKCVTDLYECDRMLQVCDRLVQVWVAVSRLSARLKTWRNLCTKFLSSAFFEFVNRWGVEFPVGSKKTNALVKGEYWWARGVHWATTRHIPLQIGELYCWHPVFLVLHVLSASVVSRQTSEIVFLCFRWR